MSLMDQLTQVVVSQMAKPAAQKTGMSEGLTEKLMPMAMAALMTGLKKNASQPNGAQALADALEYELLPLLAAPVGGDTKD